jgi:ribosomal protein S3
MEAKLSKATNANIKITVKEIKKPELNAKVV